MSILFQKPAKKIILLFIFLNALWLNIQSISADDQLLMLAVSLEIQQQQARVIYEKIIATDDDELERIESLYKQLIEQCPDTHYAQQSFWLLSSLYRFGWDKPKWQSIQDLLQKYLVEYPDSNDVDKIRKRLLNAYANLHEWENSIELYKQIFISEPYNKQNILDYAYPYAEALRMNNQIDQAIIWYQRFLTVAQDKDDLRIMYAHDTLNALREYTVSLAAPKIPVKELSSVQIAQQYIKQGNILQKKGDYSGALQAYKNSLKQQKNSSLNDRVKRLEAYLDIRKIKKP